MGKNADAVAEGVYIAAAATRLALKNQILVGTIAEGEPYELDRFVPVARETLLSLAVEAEEGAQRLVRLKRVADGRYSQSENMHDYRDRDVRNLRRRRRQYERVARELRSRADNPDELRLLVEAAREAAWGDVEANLERRLNIESSHPERDRDYDSMREARMQALRLVDLPRLGARQRRLKSARAEQEDDSEGGA